LIRRLGEAGRESGRVGVLDLLARAGLPVPGGAVLTRRAHEEFLRASGASRDLRAAACGGGSIRSRAMQIRSGYVSSPLERKLNREICEALIGLHTKAVVVLSEDLDKYGLGSIPEVRDAVVDAWLSSRGLERQLEAVARGEDLPTWPVIAQRQIHPEYIVWSTTGEAPLSGRDPAGPALHGVEPVGGIVGFTLKAGAVLGKPVSIRWGLEGGRWYVLSASSCAMGEGCSCVVTGTRGGR